MWGLTFYILKLGCLLGGMRETVRECCRSSFACGQGKGTAEARAGHGTWHARPERCCTCPEGAVRKIYRRIAPENSVGAFMLLIVSQDAKFSDVAV